MRRSRVIIAFLLLSLTVVLGPYASLFVASEVSDDLQTQIVLHAGVVDRYPDSYREPYSNYIAWVCERHPVKCYGEYASRPMLCITNESGSLTHTNLDFGEERYRTVELHPKSRWCGSIPTDLTRISVVTPTSEHTVFDGGNIESNESYRIQITEQSAIMQTAEDT